MEKSSHISTAAILPDDPRLQKFCMFAGLGGEELAALLKLTDAIACPAGSRIVQAGETGHCLYVMLEGRAKVTVDADGREILLSPLETGISSAKYRWLMMDCVPQTWSLWKTAFFSVSPA